LLKKYYVAGKYIRGLIYKLFIIKKAGKRLMIGKGVVMLHADQLKIGNNCLIDDYSYINAKSQYGISIGNNVALNRGCYLHCFGDRGGKGIIIKDNVTVGNNSIVYGHSLVKIGKFCALGPNIVIIPENHNFKDKKTPIRKQGCSRKRITIENDVWLGSGVKILNGIMVKKGSVIGAGAVVSKNTEEYSINVGVPSRKIGERV